MRRRDILKSTLVLPIATLPVSAPIQAATTGGLAAPQPFDYARLKGMARSLAGSPYQPPDTRLPPSLTKLDFDHYTVIRYNPEHALWANEDSQFRVQFFPPGYYYKEPVRMHELVDGQARELAFDPAMFDFRKSGVNTRSLPANLGFAGFRLHFHTDWNADIAAFLGASYFRAVGETRQYGLSARGLAIDTGLDSGEEFPRFTAFWLERPVKDSNRMTVYALLDSRSIAGAYRFDIAPGATLVMDVDAALYPRVPVERLGIAPLTSMFQCGENDRRVGNDWRPEIHDSDGLSIWTGAGERLWRPLVNPTGIRVNSFFDNGPQGFGLLQRDRDFDHYQDDGVYYDRRPSLWVEPKTSSGWGKGAVQLAELPAPDETFDNIVAYWNPEAKPQPGQELLFSYRMFWGENTPHTPSLAQVVATRTGIGGVIGNDRKYFSWRFAVDFAGGDLAMLSKTTKVEAVISASRGKLETISARPQLELNGYRAMFDLKPDEGTEPIDLRLFLKADGQPLTETWIYQWTPPPLALRKY